MSARAVNPADDKEFEFVSGLARGLAVLAAPWLADPTGWVEIARPYLTALRDEVGENVSAVKSYPDDFG